MKNLLFILALTILMPSMAQNKEAEIKALKEKLVKLEEDIEKERIRIITEQVFPQELPERHKKLKNDSKVKIKRKHRGVILDFRPFNEKEGQYEFYVETTKRKKKRKGWFFTSDFFNADMEIFHAGIVNEIQKINDQTDLRDGQIGEIREQIKATETKLGDLGVFPYAGANKYKSKKTPDDYKPTGEKKIYYFKDASGGCYYLNDKGEKVAAPAEKCEGQ